MYFVWKMKLYDSSRQLIELILLSVKGNSFYLHDKPLIKMIVKKLPWQFNYNNKQGRMLIKNDYNDKEG